jgi:ABC transporter with metal-binding/Fe-S-binding domain ATP-binding protein
MRVAALVTGGKDSVLALHRAQKLGHDIEVLATMIPKRSDSYMFHFPNIHLTDHLSGALGIPLVKAETAGIKEKELDDLKELLASLDVEGVVSGAVSSSYQKERIGRICQELNLKSVTPLWREDPLGLLREIIELGFETIFVGVYAYGFDQKWLGREINTATLEKLVELHEEYGISLVGEGGEYETLVLDAPFFKKRIEILKSEATYEDYTGVLLVKEAKLVDKG